MNPTARERAKTLEVALRDFHENRRPLPGIESAERRESFIMQLLDSTRRTEYVGKVLQRDLAVARLDPYSALFDPILGAIVSIRSGNIEEAYWLTFLATHFGNAHTCGWQLSQAVYGRLGLGPISTWDRTRGDVEELCAWLAANAEVIRTGPPTRKFGNHRKYESLDDRGSRGTPVTFRTYVQWITAGGSHVDIINAALTASGGDPYNAFDRLYRSMSAVASFGRLAKFDYLSMLGKLKLAPIAAGSTYLGASSGPLKGAKLLFIAGTPQAQPSSVMDGWLRQLGESLNVTMQDLEDALCNWQKSPDVYVRFNG